jgi:hypothetical protein
MKSGGFDVIIGNPPYLEYAKVKDYTVHNYATKDCANLYAFTVERSFTLNNKGVVGMIIPISMACSGAIESLRSYLAQTSRSLWLSHFSNRPGQLFTGAQNRLTIFVSSRRESCPRRFSTRYHRWDSKNGERHNLFSLLRYEELEKDASISHELLPKVGCREAVSVLLKIKSKKAVEFFVSRYGKFKVFWVRVPGYFCQFLISPPMARPEVGGKPRVRGEVIDISFDEKAVRDTVHALLNSSTYYQFFCTYTDTRHINPSDVRTYPLDLSTFSDETIRSLIESSAQLGKCFALHTTQWRKSGLLIDSVDSKFCKPIIDVVDRVLAKHYGFTEEELDFIINYDIKYRMGQDADEDDE